jgi:hypothetical protein
LEGNVPLGYCELFVARHFETDPDHKS